MLVLRPAEGAARTAAALARLGHDAVLSPATRIEPTGAPPPPGPFAGVIVTSENALPAVLEAAGALGGLPFWVVGARSAERLRGAGRTVAQAAPDAASLARRIRESAEPGRILHAAGRDRTAEPAATLGEAGFTVVAWEVYAAVPASRLSEAAAAALAAGQLSGVLHYSAHSAAIARSLADAAGLAAAFARLPQLCLSGEVACALDGTDAPVRVAAAPDEASLLALLA